VEREKRFERPSLSQVDPQLSMPKELGGWGIKYFLVFQITCSKNLWHFIQNDMLWGRVLSSKYLSGLSKVEWIRTMRNSGENGSIGWKE
jgi:hypothetical protein